MNDHEMKYLIYRIGDGLFASPLLSIREVLEYQKPKVMPNMVPSFAGVINVRGAIVGVQDLRIKFNVSQEINPKTALLLCDTEKGTVSAVVDLVECVYKFEDSEIDKKPPVQAKVAQKYLLGVAKRGSDLVTIIDLHQSLNEEEMRAS